MYAYLNGTDGRDDSLFGISSFVLYVNGTNIVTDININDGLWHYVCVAWTSQQGFYEVYMDGGLHQTGYNLSANSLIQGNGTLIVGQEQVTALLSTYLTTKKQTCKLETTFRIV